MFFFRCKSDRYHLDLDSEQSECIGFVAIFYFIFSANTFFRVERRMIGYQIASSWYFILHKFFDLLNQFCLERAENVSKKKM